MRSLLSKHPVSLAAFILVIGVTGCINPLYSPVPPPLREPGVLANDLRCRKKLFFARPGINLVWDLAQTTNASSPQKTNIVVLTSEGVAHLSADGREERFVDFEMGGELYNAKFCDVDRAPGLETLGNLPDHRTDVLVDSRGRAISHFSACDYDAPLTTDIDGDGENEIILEGRSQQLEAYRLDGTRIRSFQQDMRPWKYSVVTDDVSGRANVVLYAYSTRGVIYLLDESGKVNSKWNPPYEFYDLSIPPEGEGAFMFASGDEFFLCDSTGKALKVFSAPLGSFVRTLLCEKCVVADQNTYYIFLGKTKGAWGRSMLYIFSDSGELLYQEILLDSCNALLVRVGKSDPSEWSILVGARNKVFEYSIPATGEASGSSQ